MPTYYSGTTRTGPRWAGDYISSRESLVPGGARLDASQFSAGEGGRKFVPSGTAIGRTLAERDAGTGFGPAAAADDEIYLVAFDVDDAERNADVDLYRHGRIVKENFLPDFGDLAAGVQAALREAYTFTLGAD